ncbi:MAG: cytochrome c oxidase subunit 3, partial [Aestuariivirga sp.]
MADAHAKNHDYHLVNPSPWPAVGGASAFILAIGAVHWMHGGTWAIMALGFALVLYTMFMWWRDVI